MKSVLRSAKPYWIYLILTGKKTIEVGKDFPKFKDWNKVVEMYCSKDMKSFNRIPEQDREWMRKYLGKIACRFVCCGIMCPSYSLKLMSEQSCLSEEELFEYSNGKQLYGWRISDLKIYDNPKKLGEFKTPHCDKPDSACENCKFRIEKNTPEGYESECWVEDGRTLTRPPQSWFYVEESK